MKALTLWQPWASLIVYGEKHLETRSWSTDYRGPLAIHASQRFMREQKTLCWQSVFAQELVRHGIEQPSDLPLGKVVCIVDLVDVVPVQFVRGLLASKELAFGNYSSMRFAWKLETVRVLVQPIEARGHQGLWDCPLELTDLTFKERRLRDEHHDSMDR